MQLIRLRLLVFLFPAALIATTLLALASSFVSALETSFTPVEMTVINVQRYESDCDVLSRKIGEISRSATCGSRFDWSASDSSDESTEPATFVF